MVDEEDDRAGITAAHRVCPRETLESTCSRTIRRPEAARRDPQVERLSRERLQVMHCAVLVLHGRAHDAASAVNQLDVSVRAILGQRVGGTEGHALVAVQRLRARPLGVAGTPELLHMALAAGEDPW